MAGFFGKRTYIPQHIRNGRVQRDMRLDNVRGVLIILVVIGHFLLPLKGEPSWLSYGLQYLIYSFHMPCFVMLSGYYSKNLYVNGRFRWGKIIQILWLYVVYETIVYFTEGLVYGYVGPLPNFVRESGAPWYLLSLACWYLTVPFFQRFRGRRISAFICAAMFVGVSFLKYLINVDCLLSFDRTLSFLPFFYVGYFCSQVQIDRYIVSGWKRPVDTAAALIGLMILFGAKEWLGSYHLIVYGVDYVRYPAELHSILYLINLLWYGTAMCLSLWLIGNMLNRKMFIISDIGRNTLPIYIIHRPIRDLLEYEGFYENIDPQEPVHLLLLIAFSIMLTLILGTHIIAEVMGRLRSVFDPLLEKRNAL